jgi:hypothetical protein
MEPFFMEPRKEKNKFGNNPNFGEDMGLLVVCFVN